MMGGFAIDWSPGYAGSIELYAKATFTTGRHTLTLILILTLTLILILILISFCHNPFHVFLSIALLSSLFS